MAHIHSIKSVVDDQSVNWIIIIGSRWVFHFWWTCRCYRLTITSVPEYCVHYILVGTWVRKWGPLCMCSWRAGNITSERTSTLLKVKITVYNKVIRVNIRKNGRLKFRLWFCDFGNKTKDPENQPSAYIDPDLLLLSLIKRFSTVQNSHLNISKPYLDTWTWQSWQVLVYNCRVKLL